MDSKSSREKSSSWLSKIVSVSNSRTFNKNKKYFLKLQRSSPYVGYVLLLVASLADASVGLIVKEIDEVRQSLGGNFLQHLLFTAGPPPDPEHPVWLPRCHRLRLHGLHQALQDRQEALPALWHHEGCLHPVLCYTLLRLQVR